jgi:hypothetical protein
MGVIALCFSFLVPRGLTPGSSRITSAVPLPTGLLNTGQAALAVVRPAEWGEPPNFGRLRSCRLPNTLNAWCLGCQFCGGNLLRVDAFHYANDISANRMVRKVLND